MTTQRLLTILGILTWAAVAVTAAPHSRLQHQGSYSIAASSVSSDDDLAADCSDLHMRFDHREAIIQSEQRTIRKAEAPTLRVLAESNGGIQVRGGGSGDAYSVVLCKAVEEGSDAQTLMSQIHLTFQNGQLSVTGPDSHRRWSAHLLIQAPNDTSLDLNVHNGPLSVHEVHGRISVHAENGPVSVTSSSGELDLTTRNGPVTLENNSGKQQVRAQNGPITVALSGDSWNGEGLEAHAQNGPLTLRIPSGYRSGVVLEADGHGPFECNSSVCSEGRKTWDEDRRRIEFGSGPTVVRVSTVNGPVSVD